MARVGQNFDTSGKRNESSDSDTSVDSVDSQVTVISRQPGTKITANNSTGNRLSSPQDLLKTVNLKSATCEQPGTKPKPFDDKFSDRKSTGNRLSPPHHLGLLKTANLESTTREQPGTKTKHFEDRFSDKKSTGNRHSPPQHLGLLKTANLKSTTCEQPGTKAKHFEDRFSDKKSTGNRHSPPQHLGLLKTANLKSTTCEQPGTKPKHFEDKFSDRKSTGNRLSPPHHLGLLKTANLKSTTCEQPGTKAKHFEDRFSDTSRGTKSSKPPCSQTLPAIRPFKSVTFSSRVLHGAVDTGQSVCARRLGQGYRTPSRSVPPCTCSICKLQQGHSRQSTLCQTYLGKTDRKSDHELRSVDAERRYLSSEARGILTWLREERVCIPSRNTSPSGSADTPKSLKELSAKISEKQEHIDSLLEKGKRLDSDCEANIILKVDLQNLEFYSKNPFQLCSKGDCPKGRSASPDKELLVNATGSGHVSSASWRNDASKPWTENQSKPCKSKYLKPLEKNHFSQQQPRKGVTGKENFKVDEIRTRISSSNQEGQHKRGDTVSGCHFVNTRVDHIYSARPTYTHTILPEALYKADIATYSTMEGLVKHTTRSPIASRKGEGNPKSLSPLFDISGNRERKLHGSSPELSTPCPDSPPDAKRRRIMDDMVSLSSAVSSQVSSRSHSPTFSESTFDDSYLSTPGNSPAATLKDHFKKRYSKYELMIESDLMDLDILEACKSQDSDDDGNGANTKVSLAEFTQQYRELSEWLDQVLQVTKRTMGTLALSEKYLTQSYHEELLKQSPRHKLFNDYAKQLLQRSPSMKGEITHHLNHVNSQWEAVEKAVSCKDIWQDKEAIYRDLETDIVNLRRWLDGVEQRLFVLARPHTSDEDAHRKLLEHQVLQKDIESHSRNVNAVLKLTERLQDEQEEDIYDQNRLYLERSASILQERWHSVWLQRLEGQCKLENALETKPVFPSPQIFSGWAPGLLNFSDHDKSGLSGDDSIGFPTRPADIAESPVYPDDSLSLSQTSENHSGKDSAVVSEVDCGKMSSEYSDSDLEMFRKTRLKSEGRDIGYSSGTTESLGHLSTESDCEDIRKLIDKVDTLVADNGKVSPTRSQHPRAESSCDASSEESDGGDRYSTASDDVGREQDLMFDSVLGLDYNSDASLPHYNLPRFHDTVKLRQYKQRKDRPWSAIQLPDLGDDFDISSLSRSETAIDRLSYGSDQLSPSQKARLGGSGSSATFPRVGAKRKLCMYESSPVEETAIYSSDSDTESATSEDYDTAETDVVVSEQEDDGMNSTASFSEAAWDNYNQVYTSLGEDQEEQPLTWQQLEEDLEFDEEFPTLHSSSLVTEALEKRKREGKGKLRLMKQNSRQGYDSDSDLEDLQCFLEDSAHQLKVTDRCLMKRRKDQFRTGIALHTSKYAEIIATCQTNISCLQNVYDHLSGDATEEQTEKLKDMLYQWEKLHAFACERQQQSQSLSQLSHGLQDVQTSLQHCNVEPTQLKFSHIIVAETCLRNVQGNQEELLGIREKLSELQCKTDTFTQEHKSVSLDVLKQKLHAAELDLKLKLEMVNGELPVLEHIHATWSEYSMLCGKLESTLTKDFSSEAMTARIKAQENGASLDLEDPTVVLSNLEKMIGRLQMLRGQLLPYVDEQTKIELTTGLADLLDQMSEAQKQSKLALQTVDHPVEDIIQRSEVQNLAALSSSTDQVSSSSSSLSSPTSWLKSRYVKAAAVFMMMGVAYIVDPSIVKKIGEFSITISPELRYVNGPPPI